MRLLEAHGIEVVGEAKEGREAVELARRLNPDVLLIDLSMPEMDGLPPRRSRAGCAKSSPAR